LAADSHSISTRWRNYFSHLLNEDGINDVRQTEIHRVEPLILELRASEFELATENLKSHKSPDIDQIPAELIKAGIRTIQCEIHNLIFTILTNRNCLSSGRSGSLCVSIKTAIRQVVLIIGEYHTC
jgi:hypothetical protein